MPGGAGQRQVVEPERLANAVAAEDDEVGVHLGQPRPAGDLVAHLVGLPGLAPGADHRHGSRGIAGLEDRREHEIELGIRCPVERSGCRGARAGSAEQRGGGDTLHVHAGGDGCGVARGHDDALRIRAHREEPHALSERGGDADHDPEDGQYARGFDELCDLMEQCPTRVGWAAIVFDTGRHEGVPDGTSDPAQP